MALVAPQPDHRQAQLDQASAVAKQQGHNLGPFAAAKAIQGHDVATCSDCGSNVYVSQRGHAMGAALRDRCTGSGNLLHAHRVPAGHSVNANYTPDYAADAAGYEAEQRAYNKSELGQLQEACLLLETLAKARAIREPIWDKLHGQKVKVYRNLHNGLFSIQHRGLVVAHVPEVHLNDAQFIVHEPGRQRVIREKKKNVHAFVVGVVDHNPERGVQSLPTDVTYNPYMHKPDEKGYFVRRHDKTPITDAKSVTLRLLDAQAPDGKPTKRAVMTALEHPATSPAEDHRHGIPG